MQMHKYNIHHSHEFYVLSDYITLDAGLQIYPSPEHVCAVIFLTSTLTIVVYFLSS